MKLNNLPYALGFYSLVTFANPKPPAAPKINWTTNLYDGDRIECRFNDVLSFREAKKPGDPQIPTLKFNLEKAQLSKARQADCVLGKDNLLHLDNERFRDAIASILSKFPCKEMNVKTAARKNPHMTNIYDSKIPWKTDYIVVESCLKENPPYCIIPSGSTTPDPYIVIDFNGFSVQLQICLEDVQDAVKGGAELRDLAKENALKNKVKKK